HARLGMRRVQPVADTHTATRTGSCGTRGNCLGCNVATVRRQPPLAPMLTNANPDASTSGAQDACQLWRMSIRRRTSVGVGARGTSGPTFLVCWGPRRCGPRKPKLVANPLPAFGPGGEFL